MDRGGDRRRSRSRDGRDRRSRSRDRPIQVDRRAGVCNDFMSSGACRFGSSCKFSHTGEGGSGSGNYTRVSKEDKVRRREEMSKVSSSGVEWGKQGEEDNYSNPYGRPKVEELPEEEKEKPNFGLTGNLAKDEQHGNMVNGVVVKFSEPLDAKVPKQLWRLYVFKDEKIVETLHIHRKSAYLLGKDDRVADIVLAHESCSKQHAVVQFRCIETKNAATGEIKSVIRPYIMDLGSVNKTFLNGKEIEDCRYYELREKDSLKFGGSTREYVLLEVDM